jgi:ferric-dicitrate binding protein FerR (iron transport regulator)
MTRKSTTTVQAATWLARLGQKRVSTADIHDFFEWRRGAANDAAYRAIERNWEMTRGRFQAQADAIGFSVIDGRTGEVAQFANASIAGVSEDDALEVVRVLNRRP